MIEFQVHNVHLLHHSHFSPPMFPASLLASPLPVFGADILLFCVCWCVCSEMYHINISFKENARLFHGTNDGSIQRNIWCGVFQRKKIMAIPKHGRILENQPPYEYEDTILELHVHCHFLQVVTKMLLQLRFPHCILILLP